MKCIVRLLQQCLTSVLQIRRPFAWINSRMYVQRLKDWHGYTTTGEPVLDTFAEAQQRWHMWRRRYDLFLRCSSLELDSALLVLRLPIESHQNSYYQRLANVSLNQSQIILHSSPKSTKVSGRGISPFAAPVVKSWRVYVAPSVGLAARFSLIRASRCFSNERKGALI
jgi:hypothetical protein